MGCEQLRALTPSKPIKSRRVITVFHAQSDTKAWSSSSVAHGSMTFVTGPNTVNSQFP